MPRREPVSSILTLLLAGLLAAACSSGSDEGRLDAGIAEGNGRDIRAEYAAFQARNSGGSGDSGLAARTVADQPALHAFAKEAAAAVNRARSQGRTCGDQAFPAAGPLRWDPRVAHAALLESEWMVTTNTFAHAWPGGEQVWERLTMSGYRWYRADENIAAGYLDLDGALRAWVESPPHCVALMRADVADMAIAVVPGRDDSDYAAYWTMVLAAPRPTAAQ